MTETTNYHLNQWAKDDRIRMEDFNADNAKIDAAIAGRGNCKIVYGTYTGTGTFGEENPVKLTFGGKPLFLAVCHTSYVQFFAVWGAPSTSVHISITQVNTITTTWEGNSVSWYGRDAVSAMNSLDVTYHYVALLSVDPE